MFKSTDRDMRTRPPVASRLGGDVLVEGLHLWEVDTVFGLPGIQLDALFDGLHKNMGNIRLIHTRHEQGAAYMALGYAMVTGRPGVCTVVPGPGLLNAGAALATGYACNARILVLTSTVNSALIGRRNGALHDIEDQQGFLRSLTKWCGRASHASEIPGLLDEAFRQLMTGRPRKVAVGVPPDILGQATDVTFPLDRPDTDIVRADGNLVDRAALLCSEARNPVIIVGGGAQHAGGDILRLSRLIQAPVVSRYMGRGVIPDADDYALPAAAVLPDWKNVDLVIGIGTRLQQLREWGHDRNLKVVRIDIDQQEMTRVIVPDVAIRADSAEGTSRLVDRLGALAGRRPDRSAEFRSMKQAFRAQIEAEVQPQLAYLDAIRAEMADDDIFVDEMTQVGYASRFGLPVFAPRTYICSSYQGTLGYGYATALGAQIGAGPRRVISVNGDGGFMYTMPELASAVLHQIPLTAIIFSDGCFGNVRRLQKDNYDGRLVASHLHNPDFVELARAFGAEGKRATSPAELRAALAASRSASGPVIIEVPLNLDDIASPWKFIHAQPVR